LKKHQKKRKIIENKPNIDNI
jgi:26S proteasome regulatory subunit T2